MPQPFSIALENVFVKADPKGRMLVGGTMSTVRKDEEKDRVLQKGLLLDYFKKHGSLRWMHTPKSPKDDSPEMAKVGKPLSVEQDVMVKGKDGVLRKGTTYTAVLFKGNETAEAIWRNSQAMAAEDDCFGVSVEGNIGTRVGDDGKTIATAIVRSLAIAPHPINPDAFMTPLGLAKALTVAQVAIDAEPIAPLDKAATTESIKSVMVESRDGTNPKFTPKSKSNKDKSPKDKEKDVMEDIKTQLAAMSDEQIRGLLDPYRDKLTPVEDPEKNTLQKALTDATTSLDDLSLVLGVDRETIPTDTDSIREDVTALNKAVADIHTLLPAQSEALVVFGNLVKALSGEMTAFRQETGERLAILDDLNKSLARPAAPAGMVAGMQPLDHPATDAARAATAEGEVLSKAQALLGLKGLIIAADRDGRNDVIEGVGQFASQIESDDRLNGGISKAALNSQLKAQFGVEV